MEIIKITRRIDYVDIMKGFCILFVLLCHTDPSIFWKSLYNPIFLTGFFFCSGYTFNLQKNFQSFFIRKFRTLVVPLFFLSLINGLAGTLIKGIPFKERLLGVLFEQVNGYDSLWFFSCLFSTEMIFYFILKYSKNKIILFFLSSIICAIGYTYIYMGWYNLPWQLELAATCQIYLMLGVLFRVYEEKIDYKLFNRYFFLFILIGYLFFCFITYNKIDIHREIFSNLALYLIENFFGLLLLVMICKLIKHNRILCYLGKHSLIIFAFNGFVLSMVSKVTNFLPIAIQDIKCWINVLIAASVLSLVSHIIYVYFPFIIGKSYKKNEKK